jgi:hypothetical protein
MQCFLWARKWIIKYYFHEIPASNFEQNAFQLVLTAAWKGFHNLQVIRLDSFQENLKMTPVTQYNFRYPKLEAQV